MEVQMTDFENAAFTAFIVIVLRLEMRSIGPHSFQLTHHWENVLQNEGHFFRYDL